MLTVASLFDRVSTALGGLSGWYPSRHGFEEFARVPDGAERSHQSFVVAVPSSVPLAGRQPLSSSVGTMHRSELAVRWLYRLRVEDRVGDMALALAAEATLRNAVLATGPNPDLRIALAPEGATRQELDPSTGPMLLGELRFLVRHAIPLA